MYNAQKARQRRYRRWLRRGWRYRIPADVFERKNPPFYSVPAIQRRHFQRRVDY